MNNYQLTKYPVGTIREIWTLAWPLMLGLISSSLMLFIDRILLSWHSPQALNASANGSMAFYIFLVVPMAICAISEVLVGRLHGEGRLNEIGKPVWQTIWFALILTPLFLLIAYFLPLLLFYQSDNQAHETAYFQSLMSFAPAVCSTVALSGFFIGTGKVKFVTYSTLLANLLNVILGYLLIFGMGPIPSLGITGAGIATGLAQTFQSLLLLAFFLRKEYRVNYGTAQFNFNASYFKESLRIGAPAGSGHAVEVLAHYMFFRIVTMSGSENMTIVALVQSFYILVGFVVEAQSKGVSAIIANLIGAKSFDLIKKVFISAIKLHSLFFLVMLVILFNCSSFLFGLFFTHESSSLLQNPYFTNMIFQASLWMSIFFLFDGFSWILIGHLTSAGDTKFIFYVSSIINWVAYVLPAFFLIGLGKNGANIAWMIIALYSILNFCIYLWRYQSGKWLRSHKLAEAMTT